MPRGKKNQNRFDVNFYLSCFRNFYLIIISRSCWKKNDCLFGSREFTPSSQITQRPSGRTFLFIWLKCFLKKSFSPGWTLCKFIRFLLISFPTFSTDVWVSLRTLFRSVISRPHRGQVKPAKYIHTQSHTQKSTLMRGNPSIYSSNTRLRPKIKTVVILANQLWFPSDDSPIIGSKKPDLNITGKSVQFLFFWCRGYNQKWNK